MRVTKIMTEDPACCTPDMALSQAARLMVNNDCGEIPVVDNLETRRLVGVVTDRDIVCRAVAVGRNPENTPAGDVMSSPVIAVGEEADLDEDIEWLSGKIVRLRIFDDDDGVMNRSVQDVNGEILLISQFTLFASTKKGNRPSYLRSAKPELAVPLYEKFIARLTQDFGKPIQTGEFGAHMQIHLTNDGPVTILMDSKARE